MTITVSRRRAGARIEAAALIKVVRRTRKLIPRRRADLDELDIAIVSDQEIKTLNKKYRRQNKATDVLSFDHGQIVISYDTAKRQAKQQGQAIRTELNLLAVHGFLHILGFDHVRRPDKLEMAKLETSILGFSGLIGRGINFSE
jgi:probable rRNA maturation factor